MASGPRAGVTTPPPPDPLSGSGSVVPLLVAPLGVRLETERESLVRSKSRCRDLSRLSGERSLPGSQGEKYNFHLYSMLSWSLQRLILNVREKQQCYLHGDIVS